MAHGTIVGINHGTGMFAVQDGGGQLAVFELLDSIDLEIGDQVAGDLEALGSEDFFHVRTDETFSVYGQSGPCSVGHARAMLGG